jgi:hypothetical protein
LLRLNDGGLEGALDPFHGLGLGDAVLLADAALLVLAAGDAATRSRQDHIKVHAVNPDRRIVLDAEINVLLDTESEVARVREVLGLQLIILNAQAEVDNLLGFVAADGDMRGDLLITTDREGTNRVASCEEKL